MKIVILIISMLVLVSASVVWSADWVKKDDPQPNSPYVSIYTWQQCQVLVPRDGRSISVIALEKSKGGVTNEQFAQIVKGNVVVQTTTYLNPFNSLVTPSNFDDTHVFYRICMPAALDLPVKVKKMFGNKFGIE